MLQRKEAFVLFEQLCLATCRYWHTMLDHCPCVCVVHWFHTLTVPLTAKLPSSDHKCLLREIERFHVTSSPSRLRRKTENSRHVGVQRDRSFHGDLDKMSDILIMLLICVESDKIPLLLKLKQLYKCLPVGFLIDIGYTANNIPYKLYTKMAVYF